jgi:hypothetical protein
LICVYAFLIFARHFLGQNAKLSSAEALSARKGRFLAQGSWRYGLPLFRGTRAHAQRDALCHPKAKMKKQ